MYRAAFASLIAVVSLAGVAVALLQPAQGSPTPQQADAPPLAPYLSFTGAFSTIEDSRIVRITDEAAFKELWTEHMGDRIERNAREWDVIPQIDFTQCMVVARFRGDSWNCDGEFVVSMEDRGDDVLLRFDSATFQTSGFGGDGGGIKVTPYGIWVLPRIAKPISIEENTQGLIGEPPIWTEKARFEALTQ